MLIVVTGGAVRLSNSGLGCTDWPRCTDNRIVAPAELHAWIEFGNRLVTGLVSIIVIAAVLGALLRVPRRRDLTWLSWGLVAGVVGQIVLGGLVVLFHLWPPLVMGHFVLSQILVATAVVLHLRAARADVIDDGTPSATHETEAPRPLPRATAAPVVAIVGTQVVRVSRALLTLGALAILTGTVVTGTGPHSGSHGHTLVKRLPYSITTVARIHGTVDMLFLATVLLLVWLLRRGQAPTPVLRALETVLLVGVLQAVVGYTQYFTGVPAILVGTHILGASLLWISLLVFHLRLFAPVADLRNSADGVHAAGAGLDRHDGTGRDGAGRDLVAR